MSLKVMLDTHDEAALSALASVGLVRRAGRDMEAGKATIEARDATSATVNAEGFTVNITDSGPTDAKCTCPATGICRHILLATLALRADGDDAAEATVEETPTSTAAENLADLDEPAIRKFAGADWDKAVTQARISTEATVAEDGPNLSVQLPDTDKPVVFLAGLGLKGAVYKGPKSAKRRAVTAAALVTRMQAGTQSLDTLIQNEPTAETLAIEFLEATRKAIAAAVRGVFGGGSVIAEETLFDLSISARAQAAPRLTGLLRVLARQARQARTHHFSYNDDRFLSDAAFAFALTQALEAHPSDPALTGVLRRHYAEQDPFPLWLMGAVNWKADGGARGARIYGFSQDGAWYATGQARAAGMDPSFSPRTAYSNPLWGAGVANKLMGKQMTLTGARVSSDRQIAWDHGRGTLSEAGPHPLQAASDVGVMFDQWGDALEDLSKRMPKGLRRTGISLPLLLEVADFGAPDFDDITQRYGLPALDTNRMALTLSVPADRAEDIRWIERNKSTIAAVLCEVTVADMDLLIVPVTLYQNTRRTGFSVLNLTFDRYGRQEGGAGSMGERALSFLKSGLRPSGGAAIGPDPIRWYCEEVLGVVANALRFGGSEEPLRDVRKRAETLGLLSVSTALAQFEAAGSPEAALRVSYLVSELLRDCHITL
ncbi:MAG: SWIM zinc finger family protein [Pseudomonadota bacterium]